MQLQEELICLPTNGELKPKFNRRCYHFWLQNKITYIYSGLYAVVKKFFI